MHIKSPPKPIEYSVQTESGSVSLCDTQGEGPVALFLHGNSACKEVFQKQLNSPLGRKFRLISMDLPGHGKSENAKDPQKTYSIPGYAQTVVEVLDKMDIQRASIVGWSLGGHIALDLLKNWEGIEGVFITGTPPIPLTPEGFQQGFLPFPCLHLMGQAHFSAQEAHTFVKQAGINPNEAPFLIDATLRTDGLARSYLIDSMQKGVGGNQKETVETSDVPLAVICGAMDTGINNSYIQKGVQFKNLWKNEVQVLQGGHAIFWEAAPQFNALLDQFLIEREEL